MRIESGRPMGDRGGHPLRVDIAHRYAGGEPIEASFDLNERGKWLTLMGASGSGKTTVLRCIAGLTRVDRGRIAAGGQQWDDTDASLHWPTHRRSVGFCGQSPALMPDRNVRQNLWFGLPRSQRRRGSTGDRTAENLAKELGIASLLDRSPNELSAGQKQRVALARMLVTRPPLLLLDEPWATLDTPRRIAVRRFLRTQCRQNELTVIVASHDREDAVAADFVGIMDAGRLVQLGRSTDVFARPASVSAAELLGTETLLHGRVVDHRDGLCRVRFGSGFELHVANHRSVRLDPGDAAIVAVGGDAVAIGDDPAASVRNRFHARIETLETAGGVTRVRMLVRDDIALVATITTASATEMGLAGGQTITVSIKATAMTLLAV